VQALSFVICEPVRLHTTNGLAPSGLVSTDQALLNDLAVSRLANRAVEMFT